MWHIEQRIELEERDARDRQARDHTAHVARTRSCRRHVSFHRDSQGAHLAINALSRKPSLGWPLAILGAGFVAAWLGTWALPLLIIGVLCIAVGVPLIASRRSTIRLFASPSSFAIYTRSLARPLHVGRQPSLTVARYEWRGDLGVRIRVWNTRYWEQAFMGIAHPDDFAAVAAFNHARGRGAS